MLPDVQTRCYAVSVHCIIGIILSEGGVKVGGSGWSVLVRRIVRPSRRARRRAIVTIRLKIGWRRRRENAAARIRPFLPLFCRYCREAKTRSRSGQRVVQDGTKSQNRSLARDAATSFAFELVAFFSRKTLYAVVCRRRRHHRTGNSSMMRPKFVQ